MIEKRVIITISDKNAKAEFTSMWIRRDIDTATRTMLRDLPTHIMNLRKESTNGERSRSRKQRSRSAA